jgi:hypothetical protein
VTLVRAACEGCHHCGGAEDHHTGNAYAMESSADVQRPLRLGLLFLWATRSAPFRLYSGRTMTSIVKGISLGATSANMASAAAIKIAQ